MVGLIPACLRQYTRSIHFRVVKPVRHWVELIA